ncbi:unnamed protein product [Didymodactylos carnosus]|uniref:Uncharacterized protein n=1 Tax=Didymodactylos carnosus TaxID=1234261 RepID=A0A8S2KFG9_9BILA|nr:unnamed protein product [Didymodactylos carnosus]CAF3847288.1 unnamed protein product [Didymodactylos carnosus]
MGNFTNPPRISSPLKRKNSGTDKRLERSTSVQERKNSLNRVRSIPNGEICDIRMLRLKRNAAQPLTDTHHQEANGIGNKTVNQISESVSGEENLLKKQLDYIHSCVRRDKGLLGKSLPSCINLKNIEYDRARA